MQTGHLYSLVLGLFFISDSFAGTLPLSKFDFDQVGFDTENDAAQAAVSESVKMSRSFEYAGAIIQRDGKFYYTTPVTDNCRTEVEGYRIVKPKGSLVVALFHTHPKSPSLADDNSEVFSSADVKTAQDMHVDSFVGVMKNDTIIKYVPGADRVSQMHLSGANGFTDFANGHQIGKII
jgi:hypothetical protein